MKFKTKSRYLLMVWVAVLSVQTAYSQQIDLAPVTNTYAITNAIIVQAPGRIIPRGTVLISNGLIKQVGANVVIPSNAHIIDADSMFIYAGFIDGLSQVGLKQPEDEQIPRDVLAMDPPYKWAGITPENSAASLLDPSEKSIAQLREAGFTITQIVPHGRMLPGQGALVILSGKTAQEMIYRENTTQFAQLSGARGVFPSTTIGVMAKWRDLYNNAVSAQLHLNNYAANPSGMERPEYDPVLSALIPVTTKQMNVTFDASSDLDIHRVLTLKNELGFNLVLANVKNGWSALDKVKNSGAQVMLSFDLPKEPKTDSTKEAKTENEKEAAALEARNVAAYKDYASQAAKFSKAGILFGFSSIDAKPGDLKKNISKMVEYGLSEDAALSALTTNPAAILGVSSVAGTIDVGKIANLVITTESYFNEKSAIKYVFVDGDMYEYKAKAKKANGAEGPVVLEGVWNYTASDGNGESSGVITIIKDGDSYSGNMTNNQVPVSAEITSVSVDGSEVNFTAVFDLDGQQISVEASVSISGTSMEGSLVTPFGDSTISGERNPNN